MTAAGGATPLVVAAIDIGSTYSGYAFSAKADFLTEPLKIHTSVWHAGARSLMSFKAPTAILLKPDQTFDSFGYEAENNYSQLAEDGEHKDYYFFKDFPGLLYANKNFGRDTRVQEMGGSRTLPAIYVYSHLIRYLKDHLLDNIRKYSASIQDSDTKFVLTVSALTDDKGKQFIREAAIMGGIRETQLDTILKPEAALIYYQHLPVERAGAGNERFIKGTKSGTDYMVLNLGGYTDITVYRQHDDGTLIQLLSTKRAVFGGKSVDDAFRNFLADIVGEENMKQLQTESMEDYIDLFREFETKKRSILQDKPAKISITMPGDLMKIVTNDKRRKSVGDAVKLSPYSEDVRCTGEKLRVSNKQFQKLFSSTIAGIIKQTEAILMEDKHDGVGNILMVGGFAECDLVQNAVVQRFCQKRVIIPGDPVLAVLKGAVLYGHTPNVATYTVTRYSYGCQHWPLFNRKQHPLSKLVVLNGQMRCKDVFYTLKERGSSVSYGEEVFTVVQPLAPEEDTLNFRLYVSRDEHPRFIDDEGCEPLATLTIPLDRPIRRHVELVITVVFRKTEFVIKAQDKTSGRQCETTFTMQST